MKFCGKCHKMKVRVVTNPNNLNRYCCCGSTMLLTRDALSKRRSIAPAATARNRRKECMKIERGVEEDVVYK